MRVACRVQLVHGRTSVARGEYLHVLLDDIAVLFDIQWYGASLY